MTVAEDLREAFTGKRGKVLLIGGGLAVAGYVIYTRWNGAPASDLPAPGEDMTAVEADATRVPQTDPEVGNTNTGSTSGRPDTNLSWLSQGTDFLQGRGASATSAASALTKALDGEPLSAQERAWVSQWIAVGGYPPDGMPPLNSTAPTSTKVTAAPTNLRAKTIGKYSAVIDWTKVTNATGYNVTVTGAGKNQTYNPLFDWTTIAGLKSGTKYTVKVQGRSRDGSAGPASTISFTTKK